MACQDINNIGHCGNACFKRNIFADLCVAPGALATASNNVVEKNELDNNSAGNVFNDGEFNLLNNN